MIEKIPRIEGHSFFIFSEKADKYFFIDGGVNKGGFSTELIKLIPNANGIGFEPDPTLFRQLPDIDGVAFENLALADGDGNIELSIGNELYSSVFFGNENSKKIIVKRIGLESYCNERSVSFIDLLKLDIEGAELLVFHEVSDAFLSQSVAQITIEFHEFLDPSHIPAIRRVISRLKRIGFHYFKFSLTYTDVVFVNKSTNQMNFMDYSNFYYTKYGRGLKRIVSRLMSR